MGVELGSIILIFTGQVWNMAFSFYSSLKSIPRELTEVSTIYGYGAWQRFFQLELPYGTIGLIWNSIVSVAGGWFFLMACEMFVLGKRDFRLPGLGSYLQTAAGNGDTYAMLWGLVAMVGVILLIDQLIWRPAIAWSSKFKFEQVESTQSPTSPLLHLLRNSHVLTVFREKTVEPLGERVNLYFARHKPSRPRFPLAIDLVEITWRCCCRPGGCGGCRLRSPSGHCAAPGSQRRGIQRPDERRRRHVSARECVAAAGFRVDHTGGRCDRIQSAIGPDHAARHADRGLLFTATALFPVLLLAIVQLGGGLGVGSIALMLLGTQWYILFNVIAGASAIPSDLREVANLFHFSRADRWRIVILPGIFPYLVTGLVTASGGAWNASIVAEYFHFRGAVMSTVGLGAQIQAATDGGRFDTLLMATIIMATMVVCTNRLVWRPLYRLAETKYRLES